MKHFLIFVVVIAFDTFFTMFVGEKTDVLDLKDEQVVAEFHENEGRLTLSWKPFRYPSYYRVDTLYQTTGLVPGEPEFHRFSSEFTKDASYKVPPAAIPVYYRVSAYGISGQLTDPSPPIKNPNFTDPPIPVVISKYDESNPASLMPFLLWHTIPNAVCYEVEILSAPPDVEGGIELSKFHHLDSTRQIYTNGWQADFRPYKNLTRIYWRVRAMGLHHEPIGEFSPTQEVYLNAHAPMPDCPIINSVDKMSQSTQPLYPVYEWIPLNGIRKYEVELMTHPPAVENDSMPTPDRAWAQVVDGITSCYDEYARPYAGPYYWRVRAVDKDGNGIGTWSTSAKFVVTPHEHVTTAIFGDSISHGGGAVSYAPSSLEYSYGMYLDFPTWNISRSGDTSTTTLERFDQDVLPCNPKNLIISTGANSLRTTMIRAEDVIADIKALREKCEEHNIRPIFLTLIPINPKNIEYVFQVPTDPNWHRKMTKINSFIREQPYHIDLEPYFYDKTRTLLDYSLSVDGLHPDIRGKMLMAEIINMHKDLFLK